MFDVYVDGATGTSLEAIHELATTMAARYGLPVADLQQRLARGRFRVKADVDRATAEAYLRDLSAIGARVRIEPAAARSSAVSTTGAPLPPPSGASGPRTTRSGLPPQPEGRPSGSALPPPSGASGPRTTRSGLPPQPEGRQPGSALPPPSVATGARATRTSLPPQPEPRRSGSALPSPNVATAARATRTGLELPSQPIPTALGALERSGALSLATLDDEPANTAPTDGVLPASMGPAAPRPARAPRSRNEPIDPFAPPELAGGPEPLLELADDELAHRARKQASVPPGFTGEAARPSSPAMAAAADAARRSSSPAIGAAPRQGMASAPGPGVAPAPLGPAFGPAGSAPGMAAAAPALPAGAPGELGRRSSPALATPAELAARAAADPGRAAIATRAAPGALADRIPGMASPRARFAAGVVLAILLGFVPAHLVAGWRERGAFAAIDTTIAAVQSAAATPEAYAELDAFRDAQLDAKHAARRSIVTTSLLIWAAVGGALAYVWFRRIPWDRAI